MTSLLHKYGRKMYKLDIISSYEFKKRLVSEETSQIAYNLY